MPIQFPIHKTYLEPLIEVIEEHNAQITFDEWENLKHLQAEYIKLSTKLTSIKSEKPIRKISCKVVDERIDFDRVDSFNGFFELANRAVEIERKVKSGEVALSDLSLSCGGVLTVWVNGTEERNTIPPLVIRKNLTPWYKEQVSIIKAETETERELRELARLKAKYEVGKAV